MRFCFEFDMKKGECSKCPINNFGYHGGLCELDKYPIIPFHDRGEKYCLLEMQEEPNLVDGIDKKEKWHLYPAEKPQEEGWYMVTLQFKGEREIFFDMYDLDRGGFRQKNVIAWTERPKPYEEES